VAAPRIEHLPQASSVEALLPWNCTPQIPR
jgi:hypothetical protein